MGNRPQTILVTAGGSENRGLLKIISDVFNAEVHSFEAKDSAALGAAVRAAHCHLASRGKPRSWKELTDLYLTGKAADVVYPDGDAVRIYHGNGGLLRVFESCENFAVGSGVDPGEEIARFRKIYD
jgi:sugar (pentulose or hexulose) kinase